jgi:hypothetical protein
LSERQNDWKIAGVDITKSALEYGLKNGAFDYIMSDKFEIDPVSWVDADYLRDTDVVISTGSLSYISDYTIEKVLACIDPDRPLPVIFWPIIGQSLKKILRCLEARGLEVTEDSQPLWHRKFADHEEATYMILRYSKSRNHLNYTNLRDGVYVSTLIGRRPWGKNSQTEDNNYC